MSTTNKQLEAMSQEERAAWRESLSADEKLVLQIPVGYRVILLLIAHTKRALVRGGMTVGDQLEMLERLATLRDETFITSAVMGAVQPACATAAEMIGEALALDGENERLTKSYEMLASWECFWHFLRLNPSLLDAIQLTPSAKHAHA
jgi:hypothetical protein